MITRGLSIRSQLQLLLQIEISVRFDLCSHILCSCIPLSAEKIPIAQKLGIFIQYLGRFAHVAIEVAQ